MAAMAHHGRYITWGERIDEAKREVERAEAYLKLRPASDRLERAHAYLAALESERKVRGKRRSHTARTVNI